MEFFASTGKRPVRLSEQTRQFAYDSLMHKYGKQTMEAPGVVMDDTEGFAECTPLEKYDASIKKIAETAPIRICEGEKISGAATLGLAISHVVPATFGKEPIFPSVSHLTIDFETVLKKGINAIREDAKNALERHKNTGKEPFLKSCLSCLDAMKCWHARYLEELRGKPQYRNNYENLLNVPFAPAKSFYEAVQSIWFTFAFVRLCGNWPGIGRIDWLLGSYLEKDLSEGILTLDEAREILAHFFIKGCEWIRGADYGRRSGDAQHYQNILLSGIDEDGTDVTNAVTYLVLDIIEELGISDFPTTVRLNRNTDEKLLRRTAEVLRYGGGVLAFYNEDLIIESLTAYGYPLKEARKFANDGCWEVQIPGKTYFIYCPFDSLQILQKQTLKGYDSPVSFPDFDSLYQAYLCDLSAHVTKICTDIANRFEDTSLPQDKWKWKTATPCTVVSLFEQGCIENGLSYFEGGPMYHMISPHIGGLPDTVNALYTIKKLAFEEQKLTLSELTEILKNNWNDHEALRQYVMTKYQYFGNDNDEVDLLAADIVRHFADVCDRQSGRYGYLTPAGISTFGRQLDWSPDRMAVPTGKHAHDILSGNFSPAPGTDKNGVTAILKSYCKTDFHRTVSGAALDIKLLPSVVQGNTGLDSLIALLKSFVVLGGHFMQPDIADAELLKKAQLFPEEYQTLSVRISGWNARFVTLNKEWQDMIIAQTGSKF